MVTIYIITLCSDLLNKTALLKLYMK